jgi:sugar lactone lactonase YvrE
MVSRQPANFEKLF